MWHLFLFSLISVLISSCQPSSLEDFRLEGEGITQSILTEIKYIQTIEQLEKKKLKLKALFNALVEVMIAAHEFQNAHPEAKPLVALADSNLSDLLREELNRLCRLEGGKALLEKIQEEALNRLDAYLHRPKSLKAPHSF